MRNRLYNLHFLFLLFTFLWIPTRGQHTTKPTELCGTVPYIDSLQRIYHYSFQETRFEQQLKHYITNSSSRKISEEEEVYRIPVIVHVIHSGEPEGQGSNISFKQVVSQIEVLNDDFRRRGYGYNENPDGADTKIEFFLAERGPDGILLSEPGVDRVRFNTQWTRKSLEEQLKPQTYWNPSKYLNIWVVDFPDWLGFSGYAQFPVNSGLEGINEALPEYSDGVLIKTQYFGTNGTATAPYNMGRVATHEVGHWLGLRHIWGDGDCSKDDYCEDTPPAESPNRECLENVSCETRDMIENYMDYTPDACKNIFTLDQKARMRAVLEVSPMRRNLVRVVSDCQSALVIDEGEHSTQSLPQYYSYTAQKDEVIAISSLGLTSSDTYLELYSSCSGEVLKSNDDIRNDKQSLVTYSMMKDEEVLIKWESLDNEMNFGWQLKTSDHFIGATSDLPVLAIDGDNVLPVDSGWIWYQYPVITENMKLQIDAEDASIDVFVNSCFGGVASFVGAGSVSADGLVAGDTCYILLTGKMPEVMRMEMLPMEAGESCMSPATSVLGANAFEGAEHWSSFTTPYAGDFVILHQNDDNQESINLQVYRNCDELVGSSNIGVYRLGNVGADETYLIKWEDLGDRSGFEWMIQSHEDLAGENCHLTFNAVEGHNTYEVTQDYFELWFRYITPDYRAMLTFDFGENSSLQNFDLYKGDDCNNLDYIYSISPYPWNDSPLFEPNDTIYMVWEVDENMLLDWTIHVMPEAVGDACDNAHVSIEGINQTPGDYMNCWSRFTMPRSGKLTVTSVGLTDQDTELEIFTNCADPVQLASNDDSEGTQQSTVILDAVNAGESLILHWKNENANLPIQWNISVEDNDLPGALCVNAIEVDMSSEPLDGKAENWYRVVMPEQGNMLISSNNLTDVDTYLRVYDGCGLALVGESDDVDWYAMNFQSELLIEELNAGDELLIFWSGKWSEEPFQWQLSWKEPLPEVTDQTFELSEHTIPGTQIGQIEVAKADLADLSFSILGEGSYPFRLDAATGELFLTEAVDYETQNEYTLSVEIIKGEWSAEIVLTLLLVDEIELSTGLSKLDISVFPNPVQEELFIEKHTGEDLMAFVFDVSGEMQLSFKLTTNQHRVRVDQLKAGVYILQLNSADKSYQTKFIRR
ncbi:M43 family zinc metalloprotease [Marinoscillum pacificum]|uniref:M43 family zinc metalloprotease n=1 Tax=Marinoscillum pacificum TaxID=392723 RepID=UPI0021575397|nr:M43 family zinc metalloprotease [Marinoscillum pacificum]